MCMTTETLGEHAGGNGQQTAVGLSEEMRSPGEVHEGARAELCPKSVLHMAGGHLGKSNQPEATTASPLPACYASVTSPPL